MIRCVMGLAVCKPVVLIGMSGSGKSTLASVLAKKLNWSTSDSDVEMSQNLGRHCSELLREDAKAFRDLEVATIQDILSSKQEHFVLSVGGGAVLREETQQNLSSTRVVWLRAKPDTLITRLLSEQSLLPMLQNDPEKTIPVLLREREPTYAAVASIEVWVDEKSPDEIADGIIEALGLEAS